MRDAPQRNFPLYFNATNQGWLPLVAFVPPTNLASLLLCPQAEDMKKNYIKKFDSYNSVMKVLLYYCINLFIYYKYTDN